MQKFEACLINTDADLPYSASVYAEINDMAELVVEYRYDDDHNARRNFIKRATVDGDDTQTMATHYSTSVGELPRLLAERCDIAYGGTRSDAERIFQEALQVILDANVRYHLRDI